MTPGFTGRQLAFSYLVLLVVFSVIFAVGCAAAGATKPGTGANRPALHEYANGDRCYTWYGNTLSCVSSKP